MDIGNVRPFQGIAKARCKIKIGVYSAYSVQTIVILLGRSVEIFWKIVIFQFGFCAKTRSKITILKNFNGLHGSENGEVSVWVSLLFDLS